MMGHGAGTRAAALGGDRPGFVHDFGFREPAAREQRTGRIIDVGGITPLVNDLIGMNGSVHVVSPSTCVIG